MARKGRFESFHERFVRPRLVRYWLVPGLAGGPVALAAFWYKYNAGKTGYRLEGYEPHSMFLGAVWAGGILALKSHLDEMAMESVAKLRRSRDDALALIGWVRDVVGAKSRRFHEQFDKLPEKPTPDQVFMAITQPQEQIKQIVGAIAGFYGEHAESGEDISILLMRWQKGSAIPEFVDYYPEINPPKVRPEDFRDMTTAAGKACLAKTLVVCEDIAIDPAFKRLHPDQEGGSMFAYPIEDDAEGRVVFVVNVISTTTGRFQTSQIKEDIQLPMQVFADRLMLEERLLRLKSRVSFGR